MHLLAKEFLWTASVVLICGVLSLLFEAPVLQLLFRYGKTSLKERALSVPKRWFAHFYIFATCFHSWLACVTVRVFYLGERPSKPLLALLDAFAGQQRRPTVECTGVALAVALMWFQVLRRLFECTRLSVYSNGRMAFVHYFCGFCFYFGVGLAILSEAQGFENNLRKDFHFSLNFYHFFGILLFLLANIIQFKSHEILAKLRKDSSGRVVTYTHAIPRGHLFEWVSCPHYLAEIVIYLAISVVMGGSSHTWWLVVAFVSSNQVIVGLFNHNWYLDRFHDYPKQRKAVFPFII